MMARSFPETSIELRKHPRAQLKLPVRIRWQGSLGMRLEITETIDVSRGGLLIRRNDPHPAPSRVWVAFPFNPVAAGAVQPETPARIVRSEPHPSGGYRLALRLELPPRVGARARGSERRQTPR